jgi:hypothetical protein
MQWHSIEVSIRAQCMRYIHLEMARKTPGGNHYRNNRGIKINIFCYASFYWGINPDILQ